MKNLGFFEINPATLTEEGVFRDVLEQLLPNETGM
jgi:hypothetical protein